MTLLCSLSLHLICVSVKPEQPTPAPPDSPANAHPFNDIRFGVMPFTIALILSSICIIQPATQPELGPIESWSFPHTFPLGWQMSRWKLAIIYCSHVFIADRHDVSLCWRCDSASKPVSLCTHLPKVYYLLYYCFFRTRCVHVRIQIYTYNIKNNTKCYWIMIVE